MQINDALFPIGGYIHSYGLETYIQKNKVTNSEQAEAYMIQSLKNNFLYTELLAASLAFDAVKNQEVDKLVRLDELLTAIKVPSELRVASNKLGIRLSKMIESLELTHKAPILTQYMEKSQLLHHSVVYGALVATTEIEKDEALEFFIYRAASSMVTNCVKIIPLSQTVGQQILHRLYKLLDEIVATCKTLTLDDLGRSMPGMDIAAMQHEVLYSRLYMS